MCMKANEEKVDVDVVAFKEPRKVSPKVICCCNTVAWITVPWKCSLSIGRVANDQSHVEEVPLLMKTLLGYWGILQLQELTVAMGYNQHSRNTGLITNDLLAMLCSTKAILLFDQ